MKTRLLAILLLILTASQLRVSAQEETYKLDFGGQIGVSGYLGDASSSIFSHPGFSGGLSFRYLTDVRWSLRSLVNVLSISGDTDGMDDVFPGFARYDFKATVIEVQERVEFNFFPYGIGETYKRLRRWTPYLAAGIGLSVSTCSGQTNAGFNVPMAFGFKYKARPGVLDDESLLRPYGRPSQRPPSDKKLIRQKYRLVFQYFIFSNL